MAENGLYKFYISYSEFNYNKQIAYLNRDSNDEDENILPLSIGQLKRMMYFTLCLFALALIVFLIEFLIQIRKKWLQSEWTTRELNFYFLMKLFVDLCYRKSSNFAGDENKRQTKT